METNSIKQYALITGCSAGLGKEFAIECAKRKLNLFLVALPDSDLEVLGNEIREQYHVDVHTMGIDLTLKDAPGEVFSYAMRNNIKVNILINNAGVGFNGKLENQSVDLIDKMILLNIRASTQLTFLFLPELKKAGRAWILNVSSFAGLSPVPFKCVYAATKTYLLFLTQALNEELKGTGVSVFSVHPSGIKTDRALETIRRSSYIARLSSLQPDYVAKVALNSMFAGKTFLVPGFVTKLYYYVGMMLPYFIIIRAVGKVFRKVT
jgi:uncharacterized protein